MGHYWLAHFWALARDFRRVLFALESVNECPLGSGALAGSTLPLDRGFTSVMLGFDRTSDNSMDSVAHRDHLLDCQYAMTVLMVHASRMAEDLVIYNSREFGWVILPDAFCTGSSMMPQKKNPDMVDLLTMIKGLPMTYNRDMQEDKRALWSSVQIARDVLDVLPQLIARIEVDQERAVKAFEDGFALATDVAEYLVMKGVPFRLAHEQVGGVVKWCLDRKRTLLSLSAEEWKELVPSAADDLMAILNIESSVSRRNTQGGTSFKQVALQIERGMETLEVFRNKLASYPARFAL
jgi:argininosuccinate lyase